MTAKKKKPNKPTTTTKKKQASVVYAKDNRRQPPLTRAVHKAGSTVPSWVSISKSELAALTEHRC